MSKSIPGRPARRDDMSRLGKVISSMLPRIILIPLALCTVAMLEGLSVVDRVIQPFTSKLVGTRNAKMTS